VNGFGPELKRFVSEAIAVDVSRAGCPEPFWSGEAATVLNCIVDRCAKRGVRHAQVLFGIEYGRVAQGVREPRAWCVCGKTT
jgi:hypothetical protein